MSTVTARLGILTSLILLYVLIYASFGVASPFWPRFFETRGLSAEQIGVLFGFGALVRLVAGPIAARIADRLGQIRGVLAIAAALSACFGFGLAGTEGFWIFLLLHLCHEAALAPTTALADALTLNALKPSRSQVRFEYGWIRGPASAAFVLGTIVVGQFISSTELSAIVSMHVTLLLGAALAATLIPLPSERRSATASEISSLIAVKQLFRIVVFRRVVLVAALVFGSHAMHDAFAVIQWSAAGISPTMISVLWSEAVSSEVIIFLLVGPRLVEAVGPSRAAAIAVLSAILRWTVMALSSNELALALVQPLHGMTFALLHLTCIRIMCVRVPQHLAATSQAIYALGPAVASALLTLSSGMLYAWFGAGGFLLMALLSALALPLCPLLQDLPKR